MVQNKLQNCITLLCELFKVVFGCRITFYVTSCLGKGTSYNDCALLRYDGALLRYNGALLGYDGALLGYDGTLLGYDGTLLVYDGALLGYEIALLFREWTLLAFYRALPPVKHCF